MPPWPRDGGGGPPVGFPAEPAPSRFSSSFDWMEPIASGTLSLSPVSLQIQIVSVSTHCTLLLYTDMASFMSSPYWLGLFLQAVLGPIIRFLFRMKVVGVQRMPRAGPLIVIGNHASYLDPVLVLAVSPRYMRFFGLESVVYARGLRGFLKRCGAIPVRGKGPSNSVVKAAEVFREGDVLGLFPEGQRSFDGTVGKGRTGAALLSSQHRVPVLPVALKGAYEAYPRWARFPRLRPVTVIFGELTQVDASCAQSKALLRQETDRLMGEVEKLLKGEQRNDDV